MMEFHFYKCSTKLFRKLCYILNNFISDFGKTINRTKFSSIIKRRQKSNLCWVQLCYMLLIFNFQDIG